ncbi:MAG TPA: TetR/AcrR family transcriptional regulator [Pseudonocardia sp.]|jgi:AcrR family transcriptional regulator
MTKAVAAAASNGQRQETPRGEATRLRIRTEALELFYRQGFRATTMREITSASGLTPAAFYNHYGSKDDVLLAIIVDAFSKLDEQVDAALTKVGDSATGRLVALVHTMTLWHCDNIHQARVANRESQELDESMLGTARERLRGLRSMAEQIVTDGVEAGEFVLPEAPVEAAARVMATAMLGFVRSISAWYLEAKVLSPAELADLLVALVLRMVGAEPPGKSG